VANDSKTVTDLSDVLDQDIEALVSMRVHSERKVSQHQRLIERIVNTIGRPFSLYITALVIFLWIVGGIFHTFFGWPTFDAPPFPWLQDITSVGALLVTIMVLITQNRQSKFVEQQKHLDLQIALLTERKVSKLIGLVEDLRQDLPSIHNRLDTEAEAMKEPVNPRTALKSFNRSMQEAAKEHELDFG
jgi:uncharacterized membrane protein